MLTFDALIDGDKSFEAAGNLLEELTVLKTSPTRLLNCSHFMANQLVAKFTRQAFIDKNVHLILEPLGRFPALLPPVRE